MSTQVTVFAQRVLNELQSLTFLILFPIGDNNAFNGRLTVEHEKRKAEALESLRKLVAPLLTEGENVENCISYSGTNPADDNKEYTDFLERSLSEFVVCRSVDLYHWYLRRVVQVAIDRDPSLIRQWASVLGIGASKLASIERGENREKIIGRLFRGSEEKFRELVHNHLNIPLGETIGAYVEVRNRLIHDLGEDIEGRVAEVLVREPQLGIEVKDGQIVVGTGAAYCAPETLYSDISIIDSCLVNVLSLPTQPYVKSTIRRCA